MTRIRQSQRAKNAWVQQDGSFNIVFQQHEVPGMHIWLAPTTTLVCHLWYQTGMLFTAVMSQSCRIQLFQAPSCRGFDRYHSISVKNGPRNPTITTSSAWCHFSLLMVSINKYVARKLGWRNLRPLSAWRGTCFCCDTGFAHVLRRKDTKPIDARVLYHWDFDAMLSWTTYSNVFNRAYLVFQDCRLILPGTFFAHSICFGLCWANGMRSST